MGTNKIISSEARSFSWKDLNEGQRQSLEMLLTLLAKAQEEDGLCPPTAPTQAAHRMAFLSGCRGSGKTSVFLSLREAFDHYEKWSKRAEGIDAFARTHQLLDTLRGRVVWLDPMGLEDLDAKVNLMVSSLVRLEDAVSRPNFMVNEHGSLGPYRGSAQDSPDYRKALEDLWRLQTDAAITWGGNLKERRGKLDPDVYAGEVLRVERTRQLFHTRFGRILGALSEARSHTSRTTFILPVDDVDLSPAFSLALLSLIKTLSVPNFFLLVLGDSLVVERFVQCKVANDLEDISPANVQWLPLSWEEVHLRLGVISSSIFQKSVPPRQIVNMPPGTVNERGQAH